MGDIDGSQMKRRHTIHILALSLACVALATSAHTQQQPRSFTGLTKLGSSEGAGCRPDYSLTLYVENGTIGDHQGCVGTLQANGAFEGQCINAQRALNYRGQDTGSTISLNLEFRYPAKTCRYDAILQENHN
jgi:hypothetical protein